MFVDRYKWPDVIEDQNLFVTQIEELKSYMVEFNENGAIKAKKYPVDCIVRDNKCQIIIVITHDKYIFFANNKV